MKKQIFTLASMLLLFTAQAYACAGCVDLYPETVAFDKSVSAELSKQLSIQANSTVQVGGTELSCTKKSEEPFSSVYKTTCQIGQSFKLSGSTADSMLKAIAFLKGEILQVNEDSGVTMPPTGVKQSIGSRIISSSEYSITVGLQGAHVSCLTWRNCFLNILTITVDDLPLQP